MALIDAPVSGHSWSFRHYHVIALDGFVLMVWEFKGRSFRIFNTREQAEARAYKYDMAGNCRCAEMLFLAIEHAWPNVEDGVSSEPPPPELQ